jgi:hypothetical protein
MVLLVIGVIVLVCLLWPALTIFVVRFGFCGFFGLLRATFGKLG